MAAEKDSKYQPLPEDDESRSSEEAAFLSSQRPASKASSRRTRLIKLIWPAVFLLVWTGAVSLVCFRIAAHQRRFGNRILPSPANDYIEYSVRDFYLFEHKGSNKTESEKYETDDPRAYFTEPNPEIDDRWDELFKYANMGIDYDTIASYGLQDTTVRFPDGTYYAEFMAMHHLHCLKTLYQGLYPEYYNLTNMTPVQKRKWHVHTGHCLAALKQEVMCHADTSLFTMRYTDYIPKPIGVFETPKECINWDRLMEFGKKHAVDPTKNGMLVHPKFGPVFQDNKLVAHAPNEEEGMHHM